MDAYEFGLVMIFIGVILYLYRYKIYEIMFGYSVMNFTYTPEYNGFVGLLFILYGALIPFLSAIWLIIVLFGITIICIAEYENKNSYFRVKKNVVHFMKWVGIGVILYGIIFAFFGRL